ncbi:AAA family ATPase [Nitrolancea hollandica]|uniref:Uncharacterized AAA family ATPase y4kL n=1 Tax=Nitrolancea hollandica Lb TaxID=1129897 RepID=I4ECT3_9BACT|nr:ATP-binding protein [Nitrolancea hollandica]CCF82495.1 Uncharacterized AAA family ATPase y4kL [Nitrolancea hollandica Lb]
MARADLLKKLFQSYQHRDDEAFRIVAAALIEEERKKHHVILANELDRIMKNGRDPCLYGGAMTSLGPVPRDSERQTPLIEIKNTKRYLQDLVLSDEIRQSLERVLFEFRDWEVLETNGIPPISRVLFCGPPGCGKTATAEAIASELALPLLYVRFDSVVSSLLGETASNLRKVFEFAERGQWVMLFDEFDAIGRSRDDTTEHGEIKRVVNSFLQIMDNFTGRSLIICATNFERALDPAIWRRFDEVILFSKPTEEGIRRLIMKQLAYLLVQPTHINELTRSLAGSTYADTERVCFWIRKTCALRGDRVVRTKDIFEALRSFSYRRSILQRMIHSDAPNIDRE